MVEDIIRVDSVEDLVNFIAFTDIWLLKESSTYSFKDIKAFKLSSVSDVIDSDRGVKDNT
jgi:hypothetical protein